MKHVLARLANAKLQLQTLEPSDAVSNQALAIAREELKAAAAELERMAPPAADRGLRILELVERLLPTMAARLERIERDLGIKT